MSNWKDIYPVTHPDHVSGLETLAAIKEFGSKLPRHEAEAAAHKEYVTDQIQESAAHHLGRLHACHASGDMGNARKHAIMYGLALKELGHSAIGEPPPEVAAKLKGSENVLRFKAHPADALLTSLSKTPSTGDKR